MYFSSRTGSFDDGNDVNVTGGFNETNLRLTSVSFRDVSGSIVYVLLFSSINLK